MATNGYSDVESGEINSFEDHHHRLETPLIQEEKIFEYEFDENIEDSGSIFDSFVRRETGSVLESFLQKDNGSTRMLLLSTGVAVCGSFQYGYCMGYSAPSESGIMEDFNLSTAEYSIFGSILNIGGMLGAVMSGKVADFIGRKGAMVVSAAFCIAGWLAIFFSGGEITLDAGRFLTGCGVGLFSYVIPIYISEISPKNLRGGLTAMNTLINLCAVSVAFIMGTVMSWRVLGLIGILPCVFLLLGLWFIPESPRWLAKVGRQKEFQGALQKLRGEDADITREAVEIQVALDILQTLPKAGILDLFQRKYIRSIIIGVALMAFQQFGGLNGVGFYINETFEYAGLSDSLATFGTITYACLQVVITLIGTILMDRTGRRPLILLAATAAFLGCFIAGVSFCLKGYGLLLTLSSPLVLSGVLIYIAGNSIGMGSVPWVIMSEIFPLNIKAAAGSLVVLVNWLAAWIVTFAYSFLIAWSPAGTFFLFAGVAFMAILFVLKFVPETKGKTLEEIQALINS